MKSPAPGSPNDPGTVATPAGPEEASAINPRPTVCPVCQHAYDPNASHAQCPRCALAGALTGPRDGAPLSLQPGGSIGPYDLIDELGRGAMGCVWLARDRQLDRLVALKTLPAAPTPMLAARLEREARVAAALRHPHIIAVHGFGHAGDVLWFAMEFAEGGDLRARLRRGPLSAREAATYGAKLARALAAAHGAGVLHRDIKPSNILLDEAGEPKLADFGLASPAQGGDLTLTGQVLGTPSYLPPEILQNTSELRPAIANRLDIYALGAVLYEMLVGRPPVVGDSPAAIFAALAVQDPVAPGRLRPDLPKDLETIVLKCLERAPERRYDSASVLAADLDAFLAGRTISARPPSMTGRLWRWARRERRLAAAVGLVGLLLVAVAAISAVAAVRIDRARDLADRARDLARDEALRVKQAEAETRRQLRSALLAQASATRLTGRIGQRTNTLATLRQAAAISPGPDLQTEAILALTLPEMRPVKENIKVRANPNQLLGFDLAHDQFAVEATPGRPEVRSFLDDHLIVECGGGGGALRLRPFFSPDGRCLAARTVHDHVEVWSLEKPAAPLFTLTERGYDANAANTFYGAPDAISPDGTRLASALGTGGFTVHELPSGRELARVTTPQTITHLVFSRDGRRIAVAGGSQQVTTFLATADIDHPEDLHPLPFKDPVQTIDWSSDGTKLLAGTGSWNVIDLASGKILSSVRDTEAASGFFGPDDTMVWTVARTGAVKLWDLKSSEVLIRAAIGRGVDVALSPDRRRIIRNVNPTSMCEYTLDLPVGGHHLPSVHPILDNAIRNGALLAYSPDGLLLAQSVNGAVHLRDGVTGRLLDSHFLGTRRDYCSAIFARDGGSVFVGSSSAGFLRVPVVTNESGEKRFGPHEVLDAEPNFLVSDLSLDGKKMLLLGGGQTAIVKVVTLDGSVPAVHWDFPQPTRAVFVDRGTRVLVNGYAGIGKAPVELFDAATGRSVQQLTMTQGYEVSRSPDAHWVAIGTEPQKSGLWRTDTWTPGPALPAPLQGAFNTTTFSPDGKIIAIASAAQISLVRVSDATVLVTLQSAQSGTYITDLAFSPDGQRLAAQWVYGPITLWDFPEVHRELAAMGLDW